IRRDDGGIAELRRNLLRQQQGQIRDAWNAASESVIPLCRSYLEKVPGDSYASTVLGRMLMRSRAYAEARQLWAGICKQNPQDAHGFLQVARCCRALRMKDKGLAAAETALRLDRSLQEAAEIVAAFKGQVPQPAPAAGDAKVRRQPAA